MSFTIGDGSAQGGVDWQTVKAVLLRARPDWKPVNIGSPKPEDEANSRDYDLCQAILAAYPKCHEFAPSEQVPEKLEQYQGTSRTALD